MSGHINQDFVRGNPSTQLAMLTRVGAAVVVATVVIGALCAWLVPVFTRDEGTPIRVVVPALGTGVQTGSKVLLHGAAIGEVTGTAALPSGSVEVSVLLHESSPALITDNFDVDFRPENYFGTTAVNLISRAGGQRLLSGRTYDRRSAPDYSMSTMLTNGAIVVDGTLTKDIIASLDKVMRYADGLSPLIRTGVILADSVAKTQKQMPSTLLAKMNDTLDSLPAFNVNLMGALETWYGSVYNRGPGGGPDRVLLDEVDKGLEVAASDLFSKAGRLLKSHGSELPALTDVIKSLSDPVPAMVGGPATMDKLIAAIDGARHAFTGPAGQQALQVRLVLETLPGIQAPLARSGGTGAGKPAAPTNGGAR